MRVAAGSGDVVRAAVRVLDAGADEVADVGVAAGADVVEGVAAADGVTAEGPEHAASVVARSATAAGTTAPRAVRSVTTLEG